MSQVNKPVRLEDGSALEMFVSDHEVALVEFYRLPRRMPRGSTPWMKPTNRETNH
ncbi:hypothetical protein ACYJ1Y_09130 [Natrialbaceae archaeon A-gly3]